MSNLESSRIIFDDESLRERFYMYVQHKRFLTKCSFVLRLSKQSQLQRAMSRLEGVLQEAN